VDEVTVGSLRFEGGALGSLASTCLLARLHRAGVEVVADGMWLSLSESELLVEVDGERRAWQADGDARPRPDRDFVQAVRGGPGRIRVPWQEAYRTHQLACALARSADQGHPVELNPVEVTGHG
jgi:UDP-N-acetylglucosamine 3-dehydrogenase